MKYKSIKSRSIKYKKNKKSISYVNRRFPASDTDDTMYECTISSLLFIVV